jgi:hypothetical protein
MAVPSELSVEAIRDFMLENGGKVTNHDLVKHFKRFLTNPETRGIDSFLYGFQRYELKCGSNKFMAHPAIINIM